jgi:hypothetical protein
MKRDLPVKGNHWERQSKTLPTTIVSIWKDFRKNFKKRKRGLGKGQKPA